LALAGCRVTVIEPSPNALATLHRRAVEAGVGARITAIQGDTDALAELVPAERADLVLGHGVLEVVDDVPAALASLRTATAPGGAISVLVANRYAAVLHRAQAGRLTDAIALLDGDIGRLRGDSGRFGESQVHDGQPGAELPDMPGEQPLRRFDVEELLAVLDEAGLIVESVLGDGVVADLVPAVLLESSPKVAAALAELEARAASRPPLRDIATRLHALARRATAHA
ncbi:MAG: class I SAM-dependent methyltransferase, partial [Sciscionella sp.]|nr:class I SAM-dependent methyltransferase [Sciscionella sp.]